MKRYKVIYAPFPNAPDMTSETTIFADSEEEVKAEFRRNTAVPPGSSIKEIIEQ